MGEQKNAATYASKYRKSKGKTPKESGIGFSLLISANEQFQPKGNSGMTCMVFDRLLNANMVDQDAHCFSSCTKSNFLLTSEQGS